MNIVICTNTFTTHVGGVARSVEAFTNEYRRRGHRVLVVAPEFPDTAEFELDVFRVPAIQNFNASDFSVALPVSTRLNDTLDDFMPDIVHSQHPFLLGMTAVRISRNYKIPLVFTHHTLYEQYTHYVPADSHVLQQFVVDLATGYANLSHQVFAPSDSIRKLLIERGVTTPIAVVPTGVIVENFSQGDRKKFRAELGIKANQIVIGHMGRLAPEKNLEFLSRSVAKTLQLHPGALFVVVGSGPSEGAIREIFAEQGLAERLHICGVLQRQALADAMNGMDLFAFASHSETQGMVLTEAMAAGLPVVALDAPGVREVVRDGHNGRLIKEQTETAFSDALSWMLSRPKAKKATLVKAARKTADDFSLQHSVDSALQHFQVLIDSSAHEPHEEVAFWEQIMTRIQTEWDILKTVSNAGDDAIIETLFHPSEKKNESSNSTH